MNVTTPGGGVPRKLAGPSTPTTVPALPASLPDLRALSGDERALIREALDLSILIYAPLAKVVAALKAEGCEHVTRLDYWEMQGICFTRGERAFLVFRGTVTATHWFVDALFPPLFWPLQHLGFGFGWRALRGDVMKWIDQLPIEVPIFVTGHSLGGALAHLAAFHLAGLGRRITQVITFGAPKFAYLGTARRFNKQSANLNGQTLEAITLNVVNKHDLVARVPPRWLGFQDVGRPIQNEKDGQWCFTDRVESLLPDMVYDSADLDPEPDQPWVMPWKPADQFVMPGLAKATATDDPREFKKIRQTFYRISPPLRVLVAYPLFLFYIVRAALDHPGKFYRGGFFEKGEPWRYPLKSESMPWTTIAILALVGLAALGGLGWLFYFLVCVLIESFQRGNAAK